MSILKIEPRTPKSMQEMYDYLIDARKTDVQGLFGIGVNPRYAVQEMEFVQRYFCKERLLHPYVQMILAFDIGLCYNLLALREVCFEIGQRLVLDRRQVFGTIHYKGTDKPHCHYMINYLSIDGHMYRQCYSVYYYRQEVNRILKSHGLSPIPEAMEITVAAG